MGDFQFWLYVIIAIIYVISRMRKKQQPGENDYPSPESPKPAGRARETAHPEERQLTFEELLREITEGKVAKEPQRVPEPQVTQKPYYRNYDEEIVEEEEDLEDVNYDYRSRDSIYAQYEEAKREAFNRPSLEETLDVNKTDMTFGRFKGFESNTGQDVLHDYVKDLRDPDGLKKAFVLTEILQRKF